MIYLMNPWLLLLWILSSWVIGYLGRNKRFGFFGNFLISVAFSPLIGLVVLLASDDRVPRAKIQKN
jgi:hypothetical protein